MLKYILLLCLLLQFGACKTYVRQRSGDIKVKTVEEPSVVKENVGIKEEVKETTTHVKDDPEVVEESVNNVQVNSVITEEPVDVNEKEVNTNKEEGEVDVNHPEELSNEKVVKETVAVNNAQLPVEVKETNKNEEDVKVDKEDLVKEKGSLKNALVAEENEDSGDSFGFKQALPNLGLGNTCRVNNEVGTCVASALQCSSSRGAVLGNLGASGQCAPLAVCCQVTKTCGQSSSKRSVIFANPTQFSTTVRSCEFMVNVADPKVCQIRLDFDTFLSAGTRQVGNGPFSCLDDSFTVITPSNEEVPTICGFNSGQHMYVRVNYTNNERSIRLRFNIAGRPATINNLVLTNPLWRIRVTQLECSPNRNARNIPVRNDYPLAPQGCLQYFTARTGTVNNFGFNPNIALTANNYPPNLDYSICFRRTPSTCGMKFTVVAFSMSGSEHNCMLDYVYIPESVIFKPDGSKTTIGFSRVCSQGGAVPTDAFVQSVGQFPTFVHVVTDNVNSNNNENGFSFKYEVPPTSNCM